MTTLTFNPPPPSALREMLELPGFRALPAVIGLQEGPDSGLGPESAGAILVLSMTFSDPVKAEGFWHASLPLHRLLADAPGFIRRFTFGVEPCFYLIALWRTVEDAKAFAARPEHREAVRNLYRERLQYSHFAAIWSLESSHDRVIFCDTCDAVSPVSEGACPSCGSPFADPYKAVNV